MVENACDVFHLRLRLLEERLLERVRLRFLERPRFILRSVSASRALRPVLPPFLAIAWSFLRGIFWPFFTPAVFLNAPLFLIAPLIHLLRATEAHFLLFLRFALDEAIFNGFFAPVLRLDFLTVIVLRLPVLGTCGRVFTIWSGTVALHGIPGTVASAVAGRVEAPAGRVSCSSRRPWPPA